MAKKIPLAVSIDPDAAERIRDAAFWTDGETVSSIVEAGALDLVKRLEKKRGEPFPPRESDVRTGRPKKAP